MPTNLSVQKALFYFRFQIFEDFCSAYSCVHLTDVALRVASHARVFKSIY